MDVFEELVRLRNLGQKCALATIVEVRGSIPSFESAKILVREDGSMTGTIGGGCVEAEVWNAAREVIQTEKPKHLNFNLGQDAAYECDRAATTTKGRPRSAAASLAGRRRFWLLNYTNPAPHRRPSSQNRGLGRTRSRSIGRVASLVFKEVNSSPGIRPEMRAYRLDARRQGFFTGDAQIRGGPCRAHIKETLKQASHEPKCTKA